MLKGEGFAEPNPRPMFHNPPGLLRVEPHSPGLRDRIWWGAGSDSTAVWAAKLGMNLQSSTLKEQRVGRSLPRPAGQADPGLPRRVEGSGPRARAPGLGQPLDLRADRQAGPGVLRRPQPGRGPGRLHRRGDPGDLRPDVRRRAGQAHRAAQGGRGHRRRRHPAAHGSQPARGRVQRARDRVDPDPRGPGSRLALTNRSYRTGAADSSRASGISAVAENERLIGTAALEPRRPLLGGTGRRRGGVEHVVRAAQRIGVL